MSCYHHLTIEEREMLWKYRLLGYSIRKTAALIGRSPSMVSREWKRGHSRSKPYLPSRAQARYRIRRKRSVRLPTLLKYPDLRNQIHFFLVYFLWSPEQIVSRLRHEGYPHTCSVSTIYRSIDRDILRRTMVTYLRIKSKRIGKASKKNKPFIHRLIDQRPEEAQKRLETGHFESDTVMGYCERKCVFTHVDRKSRYLLAAVSDNKEAKSFNETTKKLFRELGIERIRTMTCDQGTEFAGTEELERELHMEVYFTHPHAPWEKGTNENTNGLLRQFLPRRKSLSWLSQQHLDRFTALLNLRPRKSLLWLTPFEVFFHSLLHFT